MCSSPLIFAHRGASKEAPENTLPAFRRAIELHADGVELDVLLTKDEIPVVMHDDNLFRLTTFRGFVRETSYEMIKKLDVMGVPIPTLEEVLALFKPSNLIVMIELKHQRGTERKVVEQTGKLVAQFQLVDRVILSSFSLRILWWCKKLFPEMKRSLLLSRAPFLKLGIFIADFFLDVDVVTPHVDLVTSETVAFLKHHKKQCSVWTINTPEQMKYVADLQVESLITDDIMLAQKVLSP